MHLEAARLRSSIDLASSSTAVEERFVILGLSAENRARVVVHCFREAKSVVHSSLDSCEYCHGGIIDGVLSSIQVGTLDIMI